MPEPEHQFVHSGYMHGTRTYECVDCGAFAADIEIGRQS